jgi:malonyl-CoA O-methyltransferase
MRHIAEQFNRAAAKYTQAAFLQHEVGTRLDERLDYINIQPRTILDLGCGTGKQLALLKTRYPQAEIIGIDFAERMLQQATAQNTDPLICASAQQLPFADNSVDLIFSNLMFQWCDPLITALQESYRVLREDGLIMFTTFGPDTLQELRYCWALVDQHPHVNEFTDMHHVGDWLMQAHFNDPVMDMEHITLTYKDVIGLMRDLQNIGATNADPKRRKTLTGKNKLQKVAEHYQQFMLGDQRLPATYEVVYGHAWKLARPKEESANTVYVNVDDINKSPLIKFAGILSDDESDSMLEAIKEIKHNKDNL